MSKLKLFFSIITGMLGGAIFGCIIALFFAVKIQNAFFLTFENSYWMTVAVIVAVFVLVGGVFHRLGAKIIAMVCSVTLGN